MLTQIEKEVMEMAKRFFRKKTANKRIKIFTLPFDTSYQEIEREVNGWCEKNNASVESVKIEYDAQTNEQVVTIIYLGKHI